MGIFDNLKYAKSAFGLGVFLSLCLPIAVLNDQRTKETDRKKNIIVDSERMRKKLADNPKLAYKTTMDILPVNIREMNSEGNSD